MKDQIKSYLQRLNHGEALESVQADFVRECKDVDPSAIMQAEQELLREGTSIEELQRLCDVHSALFHGSTTDAQKLHAKDIQDQRLSAAAALIQISGHPLQTFTLENAYSAIVFRLLHPDRSMVTSSTPISDNLVPVVLNADVSTFCNSFNPDKFIPFR